MNNVLNRATSYLRGEGSRPLLQNIADYGTAAALGTVGQQAMNIVSPGADPNPLLSGVLAAPVLTAGGRFLRGSINPFSAMADSLRINQQLANPIESRLLGASTAAGLSGLATSGINSFTGGTDYDNNVIAANVAGGGLLGSALLAGLAPLSASLINKARNISPRSVA